MSDHHDSARRHFQALQQTDFLRLEHAAYLKGLLKPFKGKGALEDWANQCFALRDDMIGLAQRRVLPQTSGYPFHLLDVERDQQNTGDRKSVVEGKSGSGRLDPGGRRIIKKKK